MLPISTLSGSIGEERTYPPIPKYYFLIKTGLENGPKNGPKNSSKNSPIVQGSIGPVHVLPYGNFFFCLFYYFSCPWLLMSMAANILSSKFAFLVVIGLTSPTIVAFVCFLGLFPFTLLVHF